MSIKKTEKGYTVDIRPQGRNGRRFRKTFKTKAEATAYKKHVDNLYRDKKPWETVDDNRHLSDLAQTWYDSHGRHLKAGDLRKPYLDAIIEGLGNPRATDFSAKDFTKYRAHRLKSVTPNTANHDLAYFKAMFGELKRLGEWEAPNPLEGIRRLKVAERELTYLDKSEIERLMEALSKSTSHANVMVKVCLTTGARWGEVLGLKKSNVRNGQVHFSDTKSGRNRNVPISPELENQILESLPFRDGKKTLERTFKRLKIELPKGQMSHVLRHTFASHYMMNGGHLKRLQEILGHSDITMTARYAHLAPDHMTEVLRLNPLAQLA